MPVIRPFCIFLTIILFFLYLPLQAQNKHALIIAIGNYKFWNQISSNNDVPFIKNALLKQGFAESNIHVLSDAKATMAGMDMAFKNLIGRARPGDIVFIHVSAHGQQVEDNNRDEADGLDESIVTWDAVKPGTTNNYAKEQLKYFRDDQFGKYMNELRTKLGKNGDVLVIMDACHSGSGTRGTHKVRGGEKPLVSKDVKTPAKTNPNDPNVFLENAGGALSQPKASFVLISAALAEELNTESEYSDGKPGGSLSIAVSTVFEKLKPGTTYRSFFAGVLSILNDIVPDQHPVMEGDGMDRELFGGKYVDQKPYIEIEELNGSKLIVKGGLLMGLDSGARIAVYPSGTINPAGTLPLASGVISAAEPFRATVALDADPQLLNAAQGWVFVTQPFYKIQPVGIGITTVTRGNNATGFSGGEAEEIQKVLRKIPVVQFGGDPELLLVKGPDKDSLKIAGNGYVFSTITKNDPGDLQKKIKSYSQYRFLQKLELQDPSAQMEVKLVPVINGKADIKAIASKTVNGVFECKVGSQKDNKTNYVCNHPDMIAIWAKNNSDQPLYLNILDMQPDGIINPIFPNTSTIPNITPEELKVNPGEEKIFPRNITICPPFGMEVFKIFVSATMIDLEKIANRDVNSRSGNFSMLEKLVDKSYDIATRGEMSVDKPNGSVYNIIFRIKERN